VPPSSAAVAVSRIGRLGLLTLDRPKAINALDLHMVRALRTALDAWRTDPSVAVVAIVGAGDRGLCAGGDVRRMRELVMGTPEEHAEAVTFWREEYELNAAIAAYATPYVAFMDGVTMGGGVGVAGHGSLRIVTERSKVAMPEAIIGFFPDVGGLHLLAQAPGEIGTHLALTGTTVNGADAVAIGFADVLVESSAIPALLDGLADGSLLGEPGTPIALDRFGRTDTPSSLMTLQPWIDECYQGDDPVTIVERLAAHPDPAAREAAAAIRARSPYSVHVILRALRRAARLGTLEAVLEQDRHLSEVYADEPDFREGVRAQLVDRDRTPHWRHPSLADVPPAEVDAAFAGLVG
jgi:enoyl-CoA hydratase/carnithine racemase